MRKLIKHGAMLLIAVACLSATKSFAQNKAANSDSVSSLSLTAAELAHVNSLLKSLNSGDLKAFQNLVAGAEAQVISIENQVFKSPTKYFEHYQQAKNAPKSKTESIELAFEGVSGRSRLASGLEVLTIRVTETFTFMNRQSQVSKQSWTLVLSTEANKTQKLAHLHMSANISSNVLLQQLQKQMQQSILVSGILGFVAALVLSFIVRRFFGFGSDNSGSWSGPLEDASAKAVTETES